MGAPRGQRDFTQRKKRGIEPISFEVKEITPEDNPSLQIINEEIKPVENKPVPYWSPDNPDSYTQHSGSLKCQMIGVTRKPGSKNRVPREVRELAGDYAFEAIDRLAYLMDNANSEMVQAYCANLLIERFAGKPTTKRSEEKLVDAIQVTYKTVKVPVKPITNTQNKKIKEQISNGEIE